MGALPLDFLRTDRINRFDRAAMLVSCFINNVHLCAVFTKRDTRQKLLHWTVPIVLSLMLNWVLVEGKKIAADGLGRKDLCDIRIVTPQTFMGI